MKIMQWFAKIPCDLKQLQQLLQSLQELESYVLKANILILFYEKEPEFITIHFPALLTVFVSQEDLNWQSRWRAHVITTTLPQKLNLPRKEISAYIARLIDVVGSAKYRMKVLEWFIYPLESKDFASFSWAEYQDAFDCLMNANCYET